MQHVLLVQPLRQLLQLHAFLFYAEAARLLRQLLLVHRVREALVVKRLLHKREERRCVVGRPQNHVLNLSVYFSARQDA